MVPLSGLEEKYGVIAVDSPPLSDWDLSRAIQVWWEAEQHGYVQEHHHADLRLIPS